MIEHRLLTRLMGALTVAVLMALVPGVTVHADLLVQGTGYPPVTFNGHGGYSADGLGQTTTGHTLEAQVPGGSTVVQAYLYAATTSGFATVDIDFDGTVVTLTRLDYNLRANEFSYRADVTAQVSAKVGPGGLITEFAVNTVEPFLNGVSLVVIYSNPLEPEVTIYLLDGGIPSNHQDVDIFYPVPINPALTDFNATLALGISYSAQTQAIVPPGSHICGDSTPSTVAPQAVFVDVNGVRLTSCAGGADDGTGLSASSQGLITVGGVGDVTDNPADPNQTTGDGAPVRVLDDELYDITGLAATNVNKLSLHFFNPSGDDQVFLAIVKIRTAGPVAGTEGPYGSSDNSCTDSVDNDGDGFIDSLDSGCAPPPETCLDGIDNDGDGLTDGQDPDCAVTGKGFKMTGGATVVANPVTGAEVKFTLNLGCDLTTKKDKLDVQWTTTDAKGKKKENKFSMTTMTSAFCTNNPFFFPKKPGKKKSDGFDTHDGSGTGKINGVTNATVFWEFLDGGEPSKQDFARLVVMDSGGNLPVIVEAPVKSGNIQAHSK